MILKLDTKSKKVRAGFWTAGLIASFILASLIWGIQIVGAFLFVGIIGGMFLLMLYMIVWGILDWLED